MGTHNICLYKEVDKKCTGCNLKTAELLIEVCAIIMSNIIYMLLILYSFPSIAHSLSGILYKCAQACRKQSSFHCLWTVWLGSSIAPNINCCYLLLATKMYCFFQPESIDNFLVPSQSFAGTYLNYLAEATNEYQ